MKRKCQRSYEAVPPRLNLFEPLQTAPNQTTMFIWAEKAGSVQSKKKNEIEKGEKPKLTLPTEFERPYLRVTEMLLGWVRIGPI